ncbi:hypothetical protein SPRG_07140 [Saprolegnia parasitica CBS 223.65]|uniref:HpcH/HpaI aldolase/citrate lyase domain-containing protein n=1 Tax=Saprolegnia parasitica (strain CBS 223.65) TaxID=695850 RepID=A0A067CBJ5_SAPPC|nr:hypothetical protein SPRG_07140 [Saprolegnia parasitica CBS 223.65]KDO27868.1 hypothetical protein SPRG_07140 [Saprolegnia parasitica CBS 223.65]|eukprot:XP_012201326.1 hypothetical protein SPRG_07140 [Saprolegnia parasitica CBS 223.65]
MARLGRLTRSVLFVPGINTALLRDLPRLACDAAMLDLEDAVAPAKKLDARALVADAITGSLGLNTEIAVRINPLASAWGAADLARAVAAGADAIVVPKVDSAAILSEVAAAMDDHGAPPSMRIWAMIETPRGVLNVDSIATSHSRLSTLVAGTSDLSKELRIELTPCRHALVPSLAMIVLAARANDLAAIDGVHFDVTQTAAFDAQLRHGVEMGFDGKTLLHASTIDKANAAFSPTQAQLQYARDVVAAHKEAMDTSAGIVVLNGKLIEQVYVKAAHDILAKHEAIRAKTH